MMKRLKLASAMVSLALVLGGGIALAQDDEEPSFELPSKVVPAEIYTCQFNDGQGMSELDAAVDGWNAYMDDNNIDNYAAWTLTKHYFGPEQEFDFIWLGAWTDGNAMGSGMDMWYSTGGEHMANFARVATCGVHINVGSINYKLPEGGTPGNAILTFANCNVEEGASYGAVSNATKEWADIMTQAGSQAAMYHWFPIYGGGGDDTADFLSVVAYPNHTEMGADYERMTNGEMFRQSNALFGDLVDCDVRRAYVATSRRSAQLR